MSIDKALNTTPELKQMYDTDADAKKLLTPLNKLKAVLDTSVSTPVLLLFLPLLSLIFLQFKPKLVVTNLSLNTKCTPVKMLA